MILTEEEAKTKWCPFVRAGSGNNRITPKDIANDEPFAGCAVGVCIASQCMGWRWSKDSDDVFSATYGYCGLTGNS